MSFGNSEGDYVQLERELRHSIESAIREDPFKYSCLTKQHHDRISSTLDEQKFRMGILPRPDVTPREKGHSFECGRFRIELFLGGTFEDKKFVPNSSVPYRWVFCPSVCADLFVDSVYEQFSRYWKIGKKALLDGNYASFVNETLNVVQENLAIMKDLVPEGEFSI